jgi:hypothetical protein
MPDTRPPPRPLPRRRVEASVLCASGRQHGVGQLVNVSLSGALIDPAAIRPRLGAPVKIRLPAAGGETIEVVGTVARHTPSGFAIQFSATNPAIRTLVEQGEIVL